MPYGDPAAQKKNADEKDYAHLKISAELKKAPAVTKYIQEGNIHTAHGCQSVRDFLKSLAAKGDKSWLEEWTVASHDNKKKILERLKMELDQKSLLTVIQTTSSGKVSSTEQVRGWMALWEVANVEKIPFEPKYTDVLMALVESDQSRPHSKPGLAAKGWREYFHVKAKAEREKLYHKDKFSSENRREDIGKEDYYEAAQAIALAGGAAVSNSKNAGRAGSADKPKATAWKAKADEFVTKITTEANQALQFALDLGIAVDKGKNAAVQRKHVNLANNWAKKFETKKAALFKMISAANLAKEEMFKDGNKFEELLKSVGELLQEWENDDNKVLLDKVLHF